MEELLVLTGAMRGSFGSTRGLLVAIGVFLATGVVGAVVLHRDWMVPMAILVVARVALFLVAQVTRRQPG